MPGIITYLVIASLVTPTLVDLGIPAIAAHMFIYIASLAALITPPDAVSCFVAAGIAHGDFMKTGWIAMRLGIMTYVLPFVVVYNAATLMIGSPAEIGLAFLIVAVATTFLAAALERFLFAALGWIETAVCAIGGVLLAYPGWATKGVGAGVCLGMLVWQLWRRQAGRHAAGSEVAKQQEPGGLAAGAVETPTGDCGLNTNSEG